MTELTVEDIELLLVCIETQGMQLQEDLEMSKSPLTREAIRTGLDKVGFLKIKLEKMIA